jgi:hypothetical protein
MRLISLKSIVVVLRGGGEPLELIRYCRGCPDLGEVKSSVRVASQRRVRAQRIALAVPP